jgi:acyl dehydratase
VLNLDAVGQSVEAEGYSWTEKDVMLYALAVGASQGNALTELRFTTENSAGLTLAVFPAFGAFVAQQSGLRPDVGTTAPGLALHAEQAVTVPGPLPAQATVRTTNTISHIFDKKSGALVVTDTTVQDAATGVTLVSARSGTFYRGEGGFGGDRGPSASWQRPGREPDAVVRYRTRPDQALLYRLTGDRNPLHSDPELARKRGNERPILHGMCTYGFAGRALLHSLCGSDPARFTSMTGRFSAPVLPGQELAVHIWADDGEARFQVTADTGAVVIDHGLCSYRP